MMLAGVLLIACLAVPHLSLAEHARIPAANDEVDQLNRTILRRDPADPKDVFGPGGPLFYGFDPNKNNLNAVKTAFIEAIILAKRALLHVQHQSSIYRRYFQPSKQTRVQQIYSYLYGEGHGPKAMRAADWPLRVVWLDSRFNGIPWEQNPCQVDPRVNALFYNEPPDRRSPAILTCSNFFFDPNIKKLSLDAWSKLDCDDIPDFMDPRLYVPAMTILHELTHWSEQTKSATGCETFAVIISDYGVNREGKFETPSGLPKHGYGAFNCMKINQRADLDSSVNADTYVWMAMEAWLNHQCPGRDIKEPVPVGPAEYTDPRDLVPP